MKEQSLFRRSRLSLSLGYSLVMGCILSLFSFAFYRSILHSNWRALERELESIAGTLHDSLEPMLSDHPTPLLQKILPELCLANQPCNPSPSLIERHTTGISDRSLYYLRLYDQRGRLLAFSPNHPRSIPKDFNPALWQTFVTERGVRFHQFTTTLHSADSLSNNTSWGYLQIGRTLAPFDDEVWRIRWILLVGVPVALVVIAFCSWWLAGLAMEPIYKSYRQQQEFTANAAHELRSPLASLLATIEAHHQDQPYSALTTIERQGRRLSRLIDDLLFLATIEQNRASFQPCCLNDLIQDLAEEFLELAIDADIHLSFQIPPELIYVIGDQAQLYRLVANLLSNALHYSPGGIVEISLEHNDTAAIIAVKDNGIGIAAAEIPRIFERFYRVNNDRSRQTGGTGLGLAIAQAIAQVHQTRIEVSSQPGCGSLFTVKIERSSTI